MRRASSIALAAVAVLAASVVAQKPKDGDPYKHLLKSTVWVLKAEDFTDGPRSGTRVTGSGSGALIDVPNRLVVTNYHVVRDSKLAVIFFPAYDRQKKLVPEREHYLSAFRARGGARATVIATDPKADLALIQLPPNSLPAGTQSLRLAREDIGPSNPVHSVGNPGVSGALWVYAAGTVRAVYQKRAQVRGSGGDAPIMLNARVIETDSPISPGDSGGPLVNAAGELVGVAQSIVVGEAGRNLSVFVDVSELKTLLKKHNFTKILTAPPVAVTASQPAEESTDKTKPVIDSPEAAKKKKETAAQNKLTFAEAYKNDAAKYKTKLQEIVKNYAGTEAAAEAQKRLDEMK